MIRRIRNNNYGKNLDFEKDTHMKALGYRDYEEQDKTQESDIINALREICDTLGLKFDHYFKPNYDEISKENFKEFCIVIARAIRTTEIN